MNIFLLSKNIKKSSQYMINAHTCKMPTESCQMLCTAFWLQGIPAPYKKTHVNNSCTKWVRESRKNFEWMIKYTKAVCKEYTHRYSKKHKSEFVLEWIIDNKHKLDLPKGSLTKLPLSMPDYCKKNSVISSYRNYYIKEKQFDKNGKFIFLWKNRKTPYWCEGLVKC